MEAVPRLPMLSFPLKTSPEGTSFSSLKKYIAECYQENPELFSKEVFALETLRNAAMHPSKDVAGCATLKRYYCQLNSLANRFPQALERNLFTFTWKDLYANNTLEITDFRYEMAAVLFNIAGHHTQLGASVDRSDPDGMKLACTHFQIAAWSYGELREKYQGINGNNDFMTPELLLFMQQVSLAHAQECILEKSLIDNRKPAIVAKVTAQIVCYYGAALAAMLSGGDDGTIADVVGNSVFKEWKKYVRFKTAYLNCILFLYQGQQSEEQQKMGERVVLYQAAWDNLEEARKESKGLANQKEIAETLTFTADVVEGKRKAAKSENEFIYHEAVPELKDIAAVQGANLVNGINFSVTDPEVAGEDIFARLIPMKAHEASSMYSEEKAQLLRKVGGEVTDKDNELNSFMSSLSIDNLNVSEERANKIPQGIVDRCASINAKPNAITDLITSMTNLAEICADVETNLKEIRELLNREEINEKKYQQESGVHRANTHFAELSREFQKYMEAHQKAGDSNDTLRRAMELHVNNLRILAKPLQEIQQSVPKLSGDISENIFHDLKLVLNKVNEMKAQRAQFCADLRIAINDDDITSKIIAYGEENDIKDLFKKEMGKHDKLVALIEQNLKAQENILAALTTQYAKVAPILKTINDVKHKRDNFFSSLAASYDVYEDLLAKSAKGLEFYKKLQGNVQKLLARVKAACDVQNEERQQRMSSTRPRVSNYAAPQNHATKSTAPKLKDYLKAGKKASTTDTTYIPPVRPSPLGSEAAPPAACIAPTSTYFPSQSQMQPPTSDYPPPPYTPPTQQYFDTNGYTNPIYQNNSISSTAGMMKYDYNYGGYDQYQNQMSQYPNMQGVMGAQMASQHYSNVQGSGSTSVSSQQPQYPNAHGGINSSVSSQPQQHPNASTVASSVSNHALTQQTTTTPQQSSQQYQYPVVPDQTSNAAYQASPLNYQYAQQPVNSSAPYSNQTSNYMQTYSPATQQPYSQTNQHTQVTQSDSSTTCPSSVPNSTNLYTQSTWPSQAVTTGFENLSIGNQGYQQPSTTDYSMTNNVTQQPTVNLPYPNNVNAIGPVYPSTDSWSTAVSTAPTQLPAQNTTSNAYPGPQNLTNQTTPTPDLPTATNYTTQQQSIDYIQSHAKTKTHGFETSPYSAQSGGYVYNQSAESGNYSGVGYQPTTSEQGNAYSSLTAPAVTNAMAIGQSGLNQYPTADNNASTSQTYSQHLQTAFTQNPVGNTTDYYALPGSYQQSTQQYAMPQTEATQQGYNNSNIPNATNYAQTVQTNGNYPQNVQNPTAAPQSAPVEAPKQQPTSLPAKKPDSKHKTSKKTSNIDLLSDIDFSANLPTPPLQPQVATPQSTENSICNEQLSSTAGSQPLQPQPAELQIPVSVQQPEEQPIATDSPAPPAPLPTLNDRKQSCDNISLCSDLSSLANESFDWDSVSLRSEQIPAAVRQQTSDSNTAATVKIRNPFDDPKVVKYFHKEVERYEKMIESLNVKMLNGNTPLVNKWKELQDLLVRDEAKRTTSIGKLFPEKNRSTDCIPYDHARVVLERSTDDYINAAFVKNLGPGCPTFIVAQTPLQNTVNDFWSMIWQQKARTVVCLHTPNEILDTFWPGDLNKEMHFDDFSVTLVNQFDLSHCTELNLKLTMHGADAILDLSLIQIKAWTKSSPVQILGIAQNILVAYKQRSQEFNSTAPLIMNCLTGSERSGLIALAICGILATQSKRPILINVVDVWYRICSQRKSALRDTNNLELSMQIVLSHGHDLLNKRGIMTSYQMKNIQRTTSVEKEEVKDPFSDLDPLWKLKQKP